MKYKTVRKLFLSQLAFILGLIVCYIIWPYEHGSVHALSDFGTTMPTVIPYAIGFTASTILMLQVARELPSGIPVNQTISQILNVLCAILFVILITPYKVNQTLFIVHMIAGSFLYVTQIIGSGWLAFQVHRDIINILLFALQLISGVVILLATEQVGLLPIHFVGLGQIVAFNCFAFLLMRVVMQVEKVHLSQLVTE